MVLTGQWGSLPGSQPERRWPHRSQGFFHNRHGFPGHSSPWRTGCYSGSRMRLPASPELLLWAQPSSARRPSTRWPTSPLRQNHHNKDTDLDSRTLLQNRHLSLKLEWAFFKKYFEQEWQLRVTAVRSWDKYCTMNPSVRLFYCSWELRKWKSHDDRESILSILRLRKSENTKMKLLIYQCQRKKVKM